MNNEVVVKLSLPEELAGFRFPESLDRRLHELLDKQDERGPLDTDERLEAEGLVALAEMLSTLRARAEVAARELPDAA
jgi:hypothetical protein